jgi:hypothetical protein
MTPLSGYLLATPSPVEITRDVVQLNRPMVNHGPTLAFSSSMFALRRWDEFKLYSPIALADEPDGKRAPFEYPVYIVRGHGKIIVLASRRRIVDYTMAQILDKHVFPNFRKVPVYLDKLIDFCQSVESEFLVTSLHGRYAGSSRNLRTMSLYGDDVTDSPIFSDHHHLFNFFSCGLGRRLFDGLPKLRPNEEGEIVRLSNDGFLTLNLSDRRKAIEFLRVVSFVIKNRWVESWVPVTEEDL